MCYNSYIERGKDINLGRDSQISILQVGDKFVVGGSEWTNHVVDDICDCIEKGI